MDQISTIDNNQETITWFVRPATQDKIKTAVALVLILVIAVMVYFASMNGWWSVFSALILVAALNRYFFTSRYSMDSEKIEARYPFGSKTLEWNHVRRFSQDKNGGYLSTRFKPSRLDAYRGMHLYFDESRERIITEISKLVKIS